ncbi:MAG: PAS domain-containing protein [Clostridiales bacterium]|nr:PAS domain-containing protein [Clostridiales bacterium]
MARAEDNLQHAMGMGNEDLSRAILHSLREGIIVVDKNLIIREFNPAAERLTGHRARDRIGQKAEVISRDSSPIFRVLETGEPIYNVDTPLKDGRIWNVNFVPLVMEGEVVGAIQTFTDVTEERRMERQLLAARDELDDAFALTLPNTKVEVKLKSTPEFQDVFDPATHTIRITGIIEDGGYRHVINALKVLADLHRKAQGHLLGIEKDHLVRAIIFHDLGKVQPQLKVGDVVDPREAFEPSKLHAYRSADIAEAFYGEHPHVVQLVRYHHHQEHELPPDFPPALLPMLRLLKLCDGLSAALTRRGSTVIVDVDATRVYWYEDTPHPRYQGAWTLNLFTGAITFEGKEIPARLKGGRVIGGR